jgi:hypothetical protein
MLGEELGYRRSPILEAEAPPADHPDKRYFPETGHTLTFVFLEFYESHGGQEVFGYPISEWFIEPNGRISQYFQRAKMEWYPENPRGQRVQLGMLGSIYVEKLIDPIHRERENPRSGPGPASKPEEQAPPVTSDVTGMHILVTFRQPIIGLKGRQTVYVYVFDQSGRGVPNASVQMEIQLRDGQTQQFALGPTNDNGHCQVEFGIGEPAPGYLITVNLTVRHQDLEARTSTAFLPWW